MEINQETRERIQAVAKALAEMWSRIRERLAKIVRNLWEKTKTVADKWYQLEEEKRVVVRQHHKRNFSRQKITHQVTNRKPQHMVRKIIR
ncbi:hypothetical protein H7992_21785 [Sporosarcina sp. resist]|uniref:hypothetical protein n=1 Tax=Sporosarcina sp. resist TaxID=2762563 RepID=UPI00164E8C6A|nr:hypothetical protein [Sporosarcina sp. resist]QNK87766.1 hypothetical protein H7992_21785 [Sporosarcina sp. resist]